MVDDELKKEYAQSLSDKFNQISALIQNESYEEVTVLGHRLAGSGGSYGFPTISELGSAIEHAGQERDITQLKTLLSTLQVEISHIQKENS